MNNLPQNINQNRLLLISNPQSSPEENKPHLSTFQNPQQVG